MSITFVLVLLIFWNIYLHSETILLRNSVEHCLQVLGNMKIAVNDTWHETMKLKDEVESDDGR